MKGRYAMPQKASDTPFCQGMEELGVKATEEREIR